MLKYILMLSCHEVDYYVVLRSGEGGGGRLLCGYHMTGRGGYCVVNT